MFDIMRYIRCLDKLLEEILKAKIYTKGGDQGETSLVGGERVAKSDIRLDAYGTLDELNSVFGQLRAQIDEIAKQPSASLGLRSFAVTLGPRAKQVQNNLFNLGSQVACAEPELAEKMPGLSLDLLANLERDMDQWESDLPPLKNFILPGGLGASAHVARTICRRAERLLVSLARVPGKIADPAGIEFKAVQFLNRLSDWLFLLARKLNQLNGQTDMEWEKG